MRDTIQRISRICEHPDYTEPFNMQGKGNDEDIILHTGWGPAHL
jgi:hypothetical protein